MDPGTKSKSTSTTTCSLKDIPVEEKSPLKLVFDITKPPNVGDSGYYIVGTGEYWMVVNDDERECACTFTSPTELDVDPFTHYLGKVAKVKGYVNLDT